MRTEPIAAQPKGRTPIKQFDRVTIYLRGEFMGNISRIDCRAVDLNSGPYAQYNNALFCTFLQKGKRKPQGLALTYKPFLVIVPTHEAIEPDSMLGPRDESGCAMSRYSGHSDGWESDFRQALEASNATVLFDAAGWNAHEKKYGEVAHV